MIYRELVNKDSWRGSDLVKGKKRKKNPWTDTNMRSNWSNHDLFAEHIRSHICMPNKYMETRLAMHVESFA
jgi:hypothetical protein